MPPSALVLGGGCRPAPRIRAAGRRDNRPRPLLPGQWGRQLGRSLLRAVIDIVPTSCSGGYPGSPVHARDAANGGEEEQTWRRKLAGMEPRGGFPRGGAGHGLPSGTRGTDGIAMAGTAAPPPLAHIAVFYRSGAEFADQVSAFVRAGLAEGDAVMVAVPRPRALIIRNALGTHADRVSFADMASLGRNPGRIIPAVHAFAESHPGQHVRYVGEPVWRSRTAAERIEAMRHEALLNIAFAAQPVSILCPYDTASLDPEVLAEAEQTHPGLMQGGSIRPSPAFAGPVVLPAHDSPLPEPPADIDVLNYRDEPGKARAFVRERARTAGLLEPRITDLVIAVGELAANTLRHTRGGGSVRLWRNSAEVVCEVRDSGHIRDPLAGRRCPAADAARGHGLWVVHQVCDLVEMRTGSSGTTFRLHMALRS